MLPLANLQTQVMYIYTRMLCHYHVCTPQIKHIGGAQSCSLEPAVHLMAAIMLADRQNVSAMHLP